MNSSIQNSEAAEGQTETTPETAATGPSPSMTPEDGWSVARQIEFNTRVAYDLGLLMSRDRVDRLEQIVLDLQRQLLDMNAPKAVAARGRR